MKEVIGLDVGTSRLVSARKAGAGFEFQSQLNAFVAIPYSRMTEIALEREKVPFSAEGDSIIVHGNESARFADFLQIEARRPMTAGFLNPAENDGGARLRRLIGSLLPEDQRGGRVYFTVPAPPIGSAEALTYHEATVRQVLTSLGYRATPLNEGLAVVYAELESSNFSGIGISFGGGLVNVTLAYLSVPVLSFSIPKAGDYIDRSTATVTGELATRVRLAKEESLHLNGTPADKLQQVLTVYYDDMIKSVVTGLRDAFASTRNVPRISQKVPVVIAGGTASPSGFRVRFEKAILEAGLPIGISEVRLSEAPLNATAKGALVAALADGDRTATAAAAATA